MSSKLRMSFSEQGAEIKGSMSLPADGTFTFECLKLAIEHMARANDLEFKEVLDDFYRFCFTEHKR